MKSSPEDRQYSSASTLIEGSRTIGIPLFVVLTVVAISIIVALALRLNSRFDAMSGWGSWVGIFVSGLALLGTSYAVLTQIRQSETTSWSIALSRLGQLYDQALVNSDYAQMLVEPSSPSIDTPPLYPPHSLTAEQRVWLGSLCLAYEQIFVATLSLGVESRRVWQIYLANQLNKPTLRAHFCRDAFTSKDYHHAFWEFVRGRKTRKGYVNGAVASIFFETYQLAPLEQPFTLDAPLIHGTLEARAVVDEDMPFWMALYSDPEVRRQMYAAPIDSLSEFKSFLRKRTVFTVFQNAQRIGGFTITRESQFMGTFGFLVHPNERGKSYGGQIMMLLEKQAIQMGLKTLRADVYDDNVRSIKNLEKSGFRRFIWMEKNL